MKRIPLVIISLYAKILTSFAQVPVPVRMTDSIPTGDQKDSIQNNDSSQYKERKLKIDEVNFVSGYYQQTGNHSGVTGGIGTEQLTDFANTIDLKLSKLSPLGNKQSLNFEVGVDTYTSASSDSIAPLSGPSRQDTRIYPSVSYSSENTKKGITVGAGISYSHEFDYESRGVNVSFIKSSKDNNREFGVHLFAYLDSWQIIYPFELRSPDMPEGSLPRNSYQASLTFSQVLNKRMQVALLFDPAYQQGQLTTLYQRVYFNDNSERVEKLPDTRLKLPVGIRINYFMGDRYIIRAYYRFYNDDWGNTAHTANLEIPVKLTPFLSLSPFYRYSVQSGIHYFAPYKEHNLSEAFYTSDYDLSPFNSQLIGMGLRLAPPNGVFGVKSCNSLELRFGHYIRSTDLVANSISLALKFK